MSGLGSFMAATRRLESGSFGGNYSALGRLVKGDRAQGAYQIMSKNWPSWSSAAGIPGADWRDPAAQDRVAAHQMSEYHRRFNGDWWRVALAWFAGGSVAQHTMDHGYRTSNDIKDAGLREYVQKIENWQNQAASEGWDEQVRGIMGGVQPPSIPSYVAPDMAAERYPNAPQPTAQGYYTTQQQIAGVSDRATDTYNQMYGLIQALANRVAEGERVDLDEFRATGIEPQPSEAAQGEVMSRDVSDLTLEEPQRQEPQRQEPI